jgi:DNA repair exonuclease SbcCD ATPase subunit
MSLETDCEVKKTLVAVEHTLTTLGDRYYQIKQDWQKYTELKQYQAELEAKKIPNPAKDPIKTELKQLLQELETLEIDLESALLPDLFWQAVRFGGLGIVIGWLLKSLAG